MVVLLLRALRDASDSAAAWNKVCDGVCVATSARLKAKLEERGAVTVVVADGPGNEAIGKTVRQLT